MSIHAWFQRGASIWLAGLLPGCMTGEGAEPQIRNKGMNQELAQVLQTSADPKELVQAAVQLANSDQPADHQVLLNALQSQAFLLQLNTQEEYWGDIRGLRVGRILDALSKNKAQSAQDTILALTKNPVFTKEEGRVDLLAKATAVIRPAPPGLVDFWDKHSRPEDASTPLIIQALIENRSRPALALLEKKMGDPTHEEQDRVIWMRTYLLTWRNQLEVLQSCERMLSGGLPPHLRPSLVEAIFDFRPGEWYVPAERWNPPPLASYSTSARALMRTIGKHALENLQLTPQQKEAVTNMLKALETQ